jgi:hypothetical protein
MSAANLNERRCTHVSDEGVRCITRLCYLNPGPECFVHAEQRRRPRDVTDPGEVERLMRQREERISA